MAGRVIPGFQSSWASVLSFAGRSLVYSGPMRPNLMESGVVLDLAFVTDDGATSGHLASTVLTATVQGASLFVLQGADGGLWRIDVPQP
jgi:hypothetical protein